MIKRILELYQDNMVFCKSSVVNSQVSQCVLALV